jgi:hypothetical protein
MKTKKLFTAFIIVILFTLTSYGQIANYNHFPTMKPLHILYEKLSQISFAFSMRVLEDNYDGPLIRLRRDPGNSQKDFGWGDNDIVDIEAINAWRNGANVFVHTWYDQSGLGRNAVQTVRSQQPRFYPDVNKPYFQGDGVDDHLTVDTPNGIQDVTTNGRDGIVLMVAKATTKNQHTFGVLDNTVSPSDRWSAHMNWSNNRLYFDPGPYASGSTRSFPNASNVSVWAQYTLMRTKNNFLVMRTNKVEKQNYLYSNSNCTLTDDFAIGWATGNETANHSTNSFIEMIMYKTDISTSEYVEIEENAITFWGI